MRVTCWIPKATNTLSEYLIPIALPLQWWLHESASMLRQYVHCLSCLFQFQLSRFRVAPEMGCVSCIFCVSCSSWLSLSQWPLYRAFTNRNKTHLIPNKILVLLPFLFFVYLFFLSFHPSHFLSPSLFSIYCPRLVVIFFCVSARPSVPWFLCFSPYCLPRVLVFMLFVSAFVWLSTLPWFLLQTFHPAMRRPCTHLTSLNSHFNEYTRSTLYKLPARCVGTKCYVNCLRNFLHCVLTHAALFDSRSSHVTHR
jgi:hypothetical protein